MSGEDVYDMAQYCPWCDTTAHPNCEPPDDDFTFACVICHVDITEEQYELDGTGFCDAHRPGEVVAQREQP